MLYTLASLFYWVFLYAPLPQILQPLILLVDLAPRWLVFLPLLLFPFFRISRRKILLYAVLTLLNVIFVIDLKISGPSKPAEGAATIRVGTYNIGGGPASVGGGSVDPARLLSWYNAQRLDVFLLQEAKPELLRPIFSAGFTLDCHGGLCVVTQHVLERRHHLDRRSLGGHGVYAALYQLDVRGHSLNLVNVHLNTPRRIMVTQKAPLTNFRRFQRMYRSHYIESMLASTMVPEDEERVIIAGDFNLTQQSGRYREYWREWENGFDIAGTGLGRTFRVGLIGVRIDHILAGSGLRVLSTDVYPAMGGDHSPVVAELVIE